MIVEIIRYIAAAIFILGGLSIMAIAVFGVYKFRFVLNRMHAAAMGDTLGILFILIGLMLANGFSFGTLKLFLVIIFLWFASPVSSHLIARLEVTTNEKIKEQCEVEE